MKGVSSLPQSSGNYLSKHSASPARNSFEAAGTTIWQYRHQTGQIFWLAFFQLVAIIAFMVPAVTRA
jgi:hypothetical protein